MKAKLKNLGILLGLSGILLLACNTDDTSLTPSLSEKDIALAKDDISADEIYIDIDAIVQEKLIVLEEANFQPLTEKSADDDFICLDVTVDYPDSTRFPKVITFDYGTGCRVILNGDTLFMEGKMSVTLTDHFFNPGAQRIVRFDNFYVNGMRVEGMLTNTFVKINRSGNFEFTLTIEDGKLTFADNEGNRLEYTRDASFMQEWVRFRPAVEDTIFMNGSMWGVNAMGLDYSREIRETLTLVHCPCYGRRFVIVDGQVASIVDGVETITDYSDGGCDGTAEIVREGHRRRIRVLEHHRNRHNGGQ